MKFLCSNCKAKYQIADEKVAGRTLRMTCRRCQEEIVIRGEPTVVPAPPYAPAVMPSGRLVSPSPSVPSPLGADFQMQLAQAVRGSSLPMPAMDEWHVAVNDVPVGPIRREDVARKLAAGAVDLDSLAWREGMDDWVPIRQIPELAVLSAPPPSTALPAVPPPLFAHPGTRGAVHTPAPYVLDPAWAHAQAERPSQIMVNPLLEVGAERRAQPSMPLMFAILCGFAFLMSALAIFGPTWRKEAPAATAGAAAAPAPKPVLPTLEVPDDTATAGPEPQQMIIDADDPALQNGARSGTARPRSGEAVASSKGPRKELTAAQKEMLARMGGQTTDLSNLGSSGAATVNRPRVTSTLSSADVSKVVLRGRKNLQRCYETALRSSGSDDTVRINVELTVSPSGGVSAVKTSGNGPTGMAGCIERTVKMWRFPQSAESSPVAFPLVFQPGA